MYGPSSDPGKKTEFLMNSFNHTLCLLRTALWKEEAEPVQLSLNEWEELYRTSLAQGVHTLVFDAFRPGCVPPQPLLANWLVQVENAEKDFERKRLVQEELCRLWTANGIKFSVMKGLSVAAMYPHPSHRLSGDIDFYFPDPESWEKAEKMAKEIADIAVDSDGDIHYLWRNVIIEHHKRWSHLSQNVEEGEVDTLLMLSGHILRHSMIGGAGLRQLTDLAVATRSLYGNYNKETFARRMLELGLGKWWGLLSAVMNSAFGIPEEELPLAPDPRYLEAYMDLIEKDGNLGKENSRIMSGWWSRFRLFVRLCPEEYFARWSKLSIGRLRRIFSNRKK